MFEYCDPGFEKPVCEALRAGRPADVRSPKATFKAALPAVTVGTLRYILLGVFRSQAVPQTNERYFIVANRHDG